MASPMSHLLTLRLFIPILIGVFSLIVTVSSYYTTREAALASSEKTLTKSVSDNLTSVQSTIELLLNIGQAQGVGAVVASYSGKPDNLLMMVVDAQGKVIASTSHVDIGSLWWESRPEINKNLVEKVLNQRTIAITTSVDKQYIDGYIGLCPRDGNNSLRTKQCGFLIQRIDLDYHNRTVTATLTSQAVLSGVGILITAVIIGILSHLLFGRRAKQLAKTVNQFYHGNHHYRSNLFGQDEISKIARSVDKMLDRIGENEKTIMAEKNRLKMLFDTVKDPIISVDENNLITSCNAAAKQAFNYNNEEIIGMCFFEIMPDIYIENDQSKKQIFTQADNQKLSELSAIKKGGMHFPVEFSINEMEDGGHKEKITVIRDITQRKRAEEELRNHRDHLEEMVALATTEITAIVQTAVNSVITIDQNGIIHMFNPAAEKMFGWKEHEVIGKNVSLLMAEINSETHDGYLDNYLKTGKAKIIGKGREVVALKKDGSSFPAHLSVGHRKLSEGNHLFVAFIADITEQKKAEGLLLKARDKAEEAARAKANFLANMSHEIRTPMNAVIGFSEVVLQDTELSDSSKQHITTILSSGKNLLGIINDILDFSKIEAGKITLESVGFHLPNALQEALRTLEFKAAEKDLILKLNVAPDIPLRVMGDPVRLRQVVLNLVGNAIKFTPSGSIAVKIGGDPESSLLHFSIEDTGIGMSEEQLSSVFDAFAQADASTNRRFGGTGLGTTISKQIVELMGGDIWAESIEGKGSIFHFTAQLPEAESSAQCLFEDGTYVSQDYRSPRKFQILLAEDIPANATLAMLRLEQQGHQLYWAKNGHEVLEALQKNDYDIILMDVQMPEMDGIEATRKIRQQENNNAPAIPIIALTASVMNEDQQLCYDAGMNNVIGKPINFSELLSSMEMFVPDGSGVPNEEVIIAVNDDNNIDFSPLEGIVNYDEGLAVWKDPLVYANALMGFANERVTNAEKIAELISQNPDDSEPARAITHALKGLAGNLAIPYVAKLSTEIDVLFKEDKQQQIEEKLALLDQELKKYALAVSCLKLPEKEPEQATQEIDKEALHEIFEGLCQAFDELNPDAVMPYISQLGKYLDKSELAPINNGCENFDFETAKKETIKLAIRLDIPLEYS